MDLQCNVHVYNILVTGFIVFPMYARKICKLTHLTSTKLELNFMNYEETVTVWRSSNYTGDCCLDPDHKSCFEYAKQRSNTDVSKKWHK